MPNGAMKEIGAANFPTPEIAITPKWVGKEAKLREFSEWSATTAKKARAKLDATDFSQLAAAARQAAAEKVYQDVIVDRHAKAVAMGDQNAPKMLQDIKPGEPNYDPFGAIHANEGSPAHEARAGKVGDAMRQRFAGTKADTVQTLVTTSDGKVIAGNKIHRGATAQAIVDAKTAKVEATKKGTPYGYAPGEQPLITETALPANQKKLHDAGVKSMANLAAQRTLIAGKPAEEAKAKIEYANALYAMFHGPVKNRGSDSTIRIFGTAMHQIIFGEPATLPHDVDIRAYALDQKSFVAWLRGKL